MCNSVKYLSEERTRYSNRRNEAFHSTKYINIISNSWF